MHVIVVLWFSKVYEYCTLNVVLRAKPKEFQYYTTQRVQPTLANHSTADLYCDATIQTAGMYFHTPYRMYEISRVHGFVLALFPLKYGFTIVQGVLYTHV